MKGVTMVALANGVTLVAAAPLLGAVALIDPAHAGVIVSTTYHAVIGGRSRRVRTARS